MFPMVATLDELGQPWRRSKGPLELGVRPELETGVMVEVPALALQAEQFAREVDFFSVGTNDLAQYTMAAERGNGALAGLLQAALAPVLALIANVVEAADAHGRWVGVCGELAGEPEAAVMLAGLGGASSAWPRAGSQPPRPLCARVTRRPPRRRPAGR